MRIKLDADAKPATDDWAPHCQALLKRIHEDKRIPHTVTVNGEFVTVALTDSTQACWRFTSRVRDFPDVIALWATRIGEMLPLSMGVETTKNPKPGGEPLVYFPRLYLTVTDRAGGLFFTLAKLLASADFMDEQTVQYLHQLSSHLDQLEADTVPF